MLIFLIYIIGLVLLLITIFTVFVHKKAKERILIWNWWIKLTATFVSTLLAFMVGILIFRWSDNSIKHDQKLKYNSLLKSELYATKGALSTEKRMYITINNTQYKVLITGIDPIVIEESIRSGLYSPKETEKLLKIARAMKMYNFRNQCILTLIGSGNGGIFSIKDLLQKLLIEHEERREIILNEIEKFSKDLNID